MIFQRQNALMERIPGCRPAVLIPAMVDDIQLSECTLSQI